MMRKMITGLLAAALIVSLCACASTDETKQETAEETAAILEQEEPETSKKDADIDTEDSQAFFMSTFEELTGSSEPEKFTAADPQPYTIYVIETGDIYAKDHLPVKMEDKTEEEISEDLKYHTIPIHEALKEEGAGLIYTSDPNRASVILVVDMEYEKSSGDYGKVTAYCCDYSMTAYNTVTHEISELQASISPSAIIQPEGDEYYVAGVTLNDEYYAWNENVVNWLCAQEKDPQNQN